MYTIDTFGRRNLVLVSLPTLSICLAVTAFGFQIPSGTGRLITVASGLYVFMIGYGPGMGPVPFSYSAESFPLYIRDFGMCECSQLQLLRDTLLIQTRSICHRNVLVLQLCSCNDLPADARVHGCGRCVRLLQCLVSHWMGARFLVRTGDEGSYA